MIFAVGLKPDDDERHDGFHDAKLQSRLFAETQKSNVVRVTGETARSVHAARLDGLASDLGHDIALTAEVFVAQGQEIVDDKS